eukprot:COSAG02_NODE_1092_length_14622_cov_95.061971_2_plen_76_part_00
MGEPYLEKAQRTGRLIVPSKLGAIPEEAYEMDLSELSLAGACPLRLLTLVLHAHACRAPPCGMGAGSSEGIACHS